MALVLRYAHSLARTRTSTHSAPRLSAGRRARSKPRVTAGTSAKRPLLAKLQLPLRPLIWYRSRGSLVPSFLSEFRQRTNCGCYLVATYRNLSPLLEWAITWAPQGWCRLA
eukprot:scaffold83184_cov56-Prasinocladus_malaysianus.AAC.1